MQIEVENTSIGNYSLEELKSYAGTKQIVRARIDKFDNGIYLDFGNEIRGFMEVSNFDCSGRNMTRTLKESEGRIICGYIKYIDYDLVYLDRASLQKDYIENFLTNLPQGSIIDTKVLSLADFGAFVDMGYGILGLLPIADISVAHLDKASDKFAVGDDIKVVYCGCKKSGYTVSHKELLGTWEECLSNFEIGREYDGRVCDIKSYGAFIEISPNLTGLSKIPEGISVGDTVKVKLSSINPEKLKVKLKYIEKSENTYKVKYDYVLNDGVIKVWEYTPDGCQKCIKTDFTISVKDMW